MDTGAGLERLARILQGVGSNYETDLFLPIIREIERKSGVPYQPGSSDSYPHHVIADHLRSLSFAIADGALPSNEGRGYVLRRILRRGARFCRELDINGPFIYKLVPTLIKVMGEYYTELQERSQHIMHVIRSEEESFGRTLDRGIAYFHQLVEKKAIGESKQISGEDAFHLYDTFGFPVDLTELMAREQEIQVDVHGFEKALEDQRSKSRAQAKFVAADTEFVTVTEGDHSEFVGYEKESVRTHLRMIRHRSGDPKAVLDPDLSDLPEFTVVLARTPFYAESGGQVADHGTIRGRQFHLKVTDVRQEGTCVSISGSPPVSRKMVNGRIT